MEESQFYLLPVPFDPVYAVEPKIPSGQTVRYRDVREEGGRKDYNLTKGVSCRHFRFTLLWSTGKKPWYVHLRNICSTEG